MNTPVSVASSAARSPSRAAGADAESIAASVRSATRLLHGIADAEAARRVWGHIPDLRNMAPDNDEEWEIASFNMKLELPPRLVSSPAAAAEWLKTCPHLSRKAVAALLFQSSSAQIVEILASQFAEADVTKNAVLVPNLRLFVAVTGIMEAIGSENPPVNSIRLLIDTFSKRYCDKAQLGMIEPRLVTGISMILIQWSQAALYGRPIPSLQDFFVEIRQGNWTQKALSSKLISDVHREFTNTGPFRAIKGKALKEHLLAQPVKAGWAYWCSSHHNNEFKLVWIGLTRHALLLFDGEERLPFAFIPMQYTHVVLGRGVSNTIEVHPFEGETLRLIRMLRGSDSVSTHFPDRIINLPFISIKFQIEAADIYSVPEWFDCMERVAFENQKKF